MITSATIIRRAYRAGKAVPAFNIPYLPMMRPVVEALRDTRCAGFIAVARLEWEKFESGSPEAVRDEYGRVKDERFTRLHLDHVPVIDEDDLRVDYAAIIRRALAAGYGSVMVDGSRLGLADNIAATREIVALAHAAGVPVEAELGAVLGHEAGPLPPYEELFASGKGFTAPDEARRFVAETGVDWLSVAIGNIHGAISAAARAKEKPRARLNLEHLERLRDATGIPLVLHGGTGIGKADVLAGMRRGIAKINVATAIRQPYEALAGQSAAAAARAVYEAAVEVVTNELELVGTAAELLAPA